MKKKCPIEDRQITVPRELMDFARRRVSDMIFMTPYQNLNQICAEAYLLACNDMTQIIPILEQKGAEK